jgi:hypothetical protein
MSDDNEWSIGDRVLAQWEPGFLYVGVIEELSEELALISFADGDAGWISFHCVMPFVLETGQDILSRRPAGMLYSRGMVEEVNGEQVLIRYADESTDWVPLERIRVRCEPIEGITHVVRRVSHFAFLEQLQVGDRVWGVWNRTAYFPGTVREFSDQQMLVNFDDGDQAWIFPADLLPLEIIPGMTVSVRSQFTPQFRPGIVTDSEGDRVLVQFEDDQEEWTTVSSLALKFW